MTFTYLGNLSTELDKVRRYVGDTVPGSGILPNSGNFTDEEIGGIITAEGSWERAVAAIFEILAGEYGLLVDTQIGDRRENLSQTAKMFETKAEQWRANQGKAVSRASFTRPTRRDAYSNDVASGE